MPLEVLGVEGRAMPGTQSALEVCGCLGWGCGCAGFPGRVPRAGGGCGRRLPAWSRAGNQTPFPHEILIWPSGGPGRRRAGRAKSGAAGCCPWCCCVSPGVGVGAQAGAGLGRGEIYTPTPLVGPLPPRMSLPVSTCLSVSATPSRKREQGPNEYFGGSSIPGSLYTYLRLG